MPAQRPDDYKRLKFFAWGSEPEQQAIMKSLGYTPVPLETGDILPSAQTGMIDVVPSTPYFALASQVYETVKHMLEINWAPIVGALVDHPAGLGQLVRPTQQALRAAGEKAGIQMRTRARQEVDEAVARHAQARPGGAPAHAGTDAGVEPAGRRACTRASAAPWCRPRLSTRSLRTSRSTAPAGRAASVRALREDAGTALCRRCWRDLDQTLAAAALLAMVAIALAEMALRPTLGRGVDNAPVLVQHLGLVMTMLGALAAERHGHLTSLGNALSSSRPPVWRQGRRCLCPAQCGRHQRHAGGGQPALSAQRNHAPARCWPTACRCGGGSCPCRLDLRFWP